MHSTGWLYVGYFNKSQRVVMEYELEVVRKVFPDWPSELDVAKCESNWAVMAQNFYCAASVLQSEFDSVHRQMHSGEPLQMAEDIFMKQHISQPALFCMAFALELAAKAATLRKTQGEGIEHAKRLPFAGHCLPELCEQLPELSLSSDDKKLLAHAAKIVVSGKYPSDIKPRNDKVPPSMPQLWLFMEGAVPIYLKLMRLSCDIQSSSTGEHHKAA
jgi:hypothetical protein